MWTPCTCCYMLFGLSAVNTHVQERPLCSLLQPPKDWLTAAVEQWWGGTVCCQSPLWKAVKVWGASCWHLGHPMGVTLGPPRPPALIIDVCRCACLHDNGVHLRSPLQCPSINHTVNRTCVFVFSRMCVWACWCVFICFVCVHTLLGELHFALLMALREGWKCE